MKLKVSKSLFINYLRCDTYAPLFSIYKDKLDAIVKMTDEEFMSFEHKSKVAEVVDHFYEVETDEDLLEKTKISDDAFQDEYKKVEALALRKVIKKYGGKTVPDVENSERQFYTKSNIEGYPFYAFIDIIQEDDKTIRIFEVKATTSRKLEDLVGLQYLKNDKGILESIYDREKVKGLGKEDERFLTPYNNYRFFYDLAFQRYVLGKDKNFNKDNKNVEYYILLLNKDYVVEPEDIKNGKVNYREDDLIKVVDANRITKIIIDYGLKADINIVVNRLNNMDGRKTILSRNCQKGNKRECIFFDYCKKQKQIPEHHNLWSLNGYHYGFKINDPLIKDKKNLEKVDFYQVLNDDKYKTIGDLPEDFFFPNGDTSTDIKRYTQREVFKTGVTKIEKEPIKAWIDNLKYPLYHFDFETLSLPIPRFVGESCYQQSPFQFSLHVESKPGVIEKENIFFLADNPEEDFRNDLVKKIVESIGDTGNIVAYNHSFERGVLERLAETFPEYKEKLLSIASRLVDLEHIFSNGKSMKPYASLKDQKGYVYYNKSQEGKTSIKKLLPLFTDLSYQNLGSIKNGGDAMAEFFVSKTYNKEQLKQYREDAIKYCALDTYSMFEILNELRKIVND